MTPRPLKHLPEDQWPPGDRLLFQAAYLPGDVFDDTGGAGAHLSAGTRKAQVYAWRRWLGFLARHFPEALELPAADRLTTQHLRAYVEHLSMEITPGSVASYVAHLYDCARIIAPDRDWSWLRTLKSRLQSRGRPQDRFERLVPGERTLDLGIVLMEEAIAAPRDPWKIREVRFRDGLILAVLSLWPIRRRSLAALTASRHLVTDSQTWELRLFPADTKANRAERWPVPPLLIPYVTRYLQDIRPSLLGNADHDAFWVNQHGGPLTGSGLYAAAARRTEEKFGRAMALHDFRRSAATFLAMTAPDKVGLTPAVLQHTSPEIGDRYYNLSRSMHASLRHAATISGVRARLRASSESSRENRL